MIVVAKKATRNGHVSTHNETTQVGIEEDEKEMRELNKPSGGGSAGKDGSRRNNPGQKRRKHSDQGRNRHTFPPTA